MEAATITHLHPAHQLDSLRRQDLALKIIKNEEPVSDIARTNNVSRKFLYQQKDKAIAGIHSKFNQSDDSDVIFYLPITKAWIISFIMCLLLHCRSSFRGLQKILMDTIDYKVSIGTISNYVKSAAVKAKTINLE